MAVAVGPRGLACEWVRVRVRVRVRAWQQGGGSRVAAAVGLCGSSKVVAAGSSRAVGTIVGQVCGASTLCVVPASGAT